MKKFFAALFATFFLLLPVCANDEIPEKNQSFAFSAEPFLGLSFGKFGEYVFSWSDYYVCSYLEWNVTPLVFGGANLNFGFRDFEINFSASAGIPYKCGKMYDSDWNDCGIKTTYSIHENYASTNFDFDILLKYNFKFGQFALSPIFQTETTYNSFKSKNGRGWYGGSSYNTSGTGNDVSWNSPFAKYYRVSKIDLKRFDFYTFLGLDFDIDFSARFSISVSSYFSPYTYCSYSDYHHDGTENGNDFYLNSCHSCFFLRFKEKFAVRFYLTKFCKLNLGASWLFGPVAKGLLEGYEQNGGSDISLVKISVGSELIF